MSLLGVLLWVLIAVAVFIATVLFMPFGLRLRASIGETSRWSVAAQPFGRFGPVIRTHGHRTERKPKPKTPASIHSNVHRRRALAAGARFVSDILSAIHIRNLSLNVRFGCSDPADTGHVYGLLTPILYGTSGCHRLRLRVVPEFDHAELEGEAELHIWFVPAALVPPIARFAWTVLRPVK